MKILFVLVLRSFIYYVINVMATAYHMLTTPPRVFRDPKMCLRNIWTAPNNQFRVEIRHKYEGPDLMSPDGPNDPPPFGLKIYKGAKAWRAPRTFVEFLLHHPVAKQFLEWAKYTYISDETVVATLARVSEVRWRRDGTWEVRQDHEPLGRYHLQLWDQGACRGVMRHGVCVFSLLDLSTILSANTIVINKVMTEHDAAVAECLRDNIRKREVLE